MSCIVNDDVINIGSTTSISDDSDIATDRNLTINDSNITTDSNSTINDNILLLYTNCDSGLLNKRDELKVIISEKNPDIIQLTEVYPKKNHQVDPSLDFNIDGYNLYYNPNPARGVITYIRSSIDVSPCDVLSEGTLYLNEYVWNVLKINSLTLLLGCVYRSGSNDKNASTTELINMLKNIDQSRYDKVIVTGDFNYPDINWDDFSQNNNIECQFVNCLEDLYLQQLVAEPTRHRGDQKPNLLDLVISNDDDCIVNIEHLPPLGKSDHDLLTVSLNIPKELSSNSNSDIRFCFRKTNFVGFSKYLKDTDWEKLDGASCEEATAYFENVLYEGFNKFVPKQKEQKKKQRFWLNNKAMRLIRKKYVMYKRYTHSRDYSLTSIQYDYQQYIETRNKAKRELRKSVKDYERKICQDSKQNAKGFWRYVNTKLKRTTGVCNLSKPDGELTKNDLEKSKVLNDFFSSVFVKEDLDNIPELPMRNKDKFLKSIVITREDIETKLKNLNPNKATGPDKIPPLILKKLAHELSFPLHTIFNKSISENHVPSKWRMSDISGIFKKGAKNLASNYRPVSLTCILCKVLESFVRDALLKYMEENNFFSKCQHGFRRHRSCVTQLLEVLNDLTNLIEEKLDFDILYLDFAKAFDTVPHQRLLNKLKAYGIEGDILNWISSFLSNRTQRVRVNNSYSEYTTVDSGIPQGSVLGPVLFTIYINDLPDVVESICKIFADDTKLYGRASNRDSIQKDLKALMEWSKLWLLSFNIPKCSVLHMGKNNPEHKYYMDTDKELATTTAEKDIGVIFTNEMNFNVHINNVAKKGNQMAGLIKRTFTYLDSDMFVKLYKSVVRPHLEYANVIWHPMLKGHQVLIENVQRRATKMVYSLKDLPYSERLQLLNLPSIKYRQLRGDLIQTYKIVHNIDNLDKDNFFKPNPSTTTRNSQLKLEKEFSKSSIRANFLSNRVKNSWNGLPEKIKTAENLNSFKNLIDEELFHLKYSYYGDKN